MSESLDSPTYGEAEKPRDPISPLNPRRAERFNPTRFTLHTGGFSFSTPSVLPRLLLCAGWRIVLLRYRPGLRC